MDPYGQCEQRSGSGGAIGPHRRSFSSSQAERGGFHADPRAYNNFGGYAQGYPPPPPSSHERERERERDYNRGYGYGYGGMSYRNSPRYDQRETTCLGCGLDRRSRRRLRRWIYILLVMLAIALVAYHRLSGTDLRSKVADVVIGGIIDEVVNTHRKAEPIRPDTIVPPDVGVMSRQGQAAAESHAQRGARGEEGAEHDRPPSKNAPIPPELEERGILEADPLDIPPTKLSMAQASEKQASALLDAVQRVAAIPPSNPEGSVSAIAASDNPSAQLREVLGLGEVSLKRLNEQIEELTRKLTAQTNLVEELHRNIDRTNEKLGKQEQQPKQSTMGEDLIRKIQKDTAETQAAKRQQPSEGDHATFSRPVTFSLPPVSTVMCYGNATLDRVCKFKNLCYDTMHDRFLVFKSAHSLEMGVPANRSYLVDTTSIDGHNKFFFDYAEVHPENFRSRTVQLVDRLTFMISRFHALNIMHTIHDDFMGLYVLHRMFAQNDEDDPRYSFSRRNNIFFLDSFEKLRYDYIFQFLTERPLQFRIEWKEKRRSEELLCFREAVVGNSKLSSWYSYGFLEPQGPIPNKNVSGLLVRDASRYLMTLMNLPAWDEAAIRNILQDLYVKVMKRRAERKPRTKMPLLSGETDGVFITLFSRQLDRLIVNEAELIKGLQDTFGLPVKTVRMEDMHLGQQVAILRSTAIAIGVHGSALILSMFLPPGAILLEIFPYAVPAENYTPYKTLCNLQGMRLAYRAWSNRKVENNFPHPERPPTGGGIHHLSLAEQEKIQNTLTVPPHLCCRDPYWLYRIYQDTRVDLPELFDTIEDGLADALELLRVNPQDYVYVRPGVVESLQCQTILPDGIDATHVDNTTKIDLQLTWNEPWNGVIPLKYGIWIHQPYQEFFAPKPLLVLQNCTLGSRYDIWVRPYTYGPSGNDTLLKGQYSEKFTCFCKPNTTAKKTDITDL